MISADDAVALQLALDADQAELTVRREVYSAATARRPGSAAVAADIATVRRTWAGLCALAEELAADPAAAEIVEACAEYLVGVQVNERGVDRLGELGLTLSEVLPPQ